MSQILLDKSIEAKNRRERIRDIARDMYAVGGFIPGGVVRIADHAHVHELEDGAFVEAVVWVPRERI